MGKKVNYQSPQLLNYEQSHLVDTVGKRDSLVLYSVFSFFISLKHYNCYEKSSIHLINFTYHP
jgi:hypothetical protein